MRIFSFLFCLFIIISCSTTNRDLSHTPISLSRQDGFYIEKLSNSSNYAHLFVKDSLLDSIYFGYYKNGQLEREANFSKGLLNGKRSIYWKNGSIHYILYYKYGKPDGLGFTYRKNGSLKVESMYSGGFVNGPSTDYKRDGKQKTQWYYIDGEKQNIWKSYHYYSNDTLQTSYYLNKLKMADSAYQEYFRNGNLKKTGNYKNHKKDGEWTFYESNGGIKKTVQYIEGKKQ